MSKPERTEPCQAERDTSRSLPCAASFPTTRWTLVKALESKSEAGDDRNWNQFISRYWQVLFNSLLRRGVSRHDAEDAVQGFLKKLWTSDTFPSCLKIESHSLRAFLSASLKNYWLDMLRKETTQKRGGRASHQELDDNLRLALPEEDPQFDQEWARATVSQACERLRIDYALRGQAEFFEQALILLEDQNQETLQNARQTLDIRANTLAVGLKRFRERLARLVREEVKASLYEPSEETLNAEIRHLLRALEQAGGIGNLVRESSRTEKAVDQNDGSGPSGERG